MRSGDETSKDVSFHCFFFFNCVSCVYFVCWQVAMSKFDKNSSINYERMAENLKIVRDRLDMSP